jgi:hypothetical protein
VKYIYVVCKKFAEWCQKTNKTEDTHTLTFLACKIIAIFHHTLLAKFIKLLDTVSQGLCRTRTQNRRHSSWIAAIWRPKPSDFRVEKIHSVLSFGGEVKPSVPCHRFAACKKNPAIYVEVGIAGQNYQAISRPIPSFTNRGLSLRLTWNASGDDGRN